MEKVLIFSAPSGSGKTTLVQHVLGTIHHLAFSVSCTTRAPRGQEMDGKDYHFLTVEDFKNKINENAFIEYEEVYKDTFYGTLKSEVELLWQQNKVVVFDVDVQGGISLKRYFGNKSRSFFIQPPSIQELERRLVSRNTDSKETIKMRLDKAEEELSFASKFDEIIINEDLSLAKKAIENSILHFLTT